MVRRTMLLGGLALLITAASTVQAQEGRQGRGGQGPGGFGGFAGPADLLRAPEVQKELGVTDEQKGLIEDMVVDLGEQRRNLFGGFQGFENASEEERQKLREEFRKKSEELGKKTDEMLAMILEPKQLERMSQLRIQSEGPAALLRPAVADKLKLSQEQRDKIRKIQQDAMPRFDGRNFQGFRNLQNASEEEKAKAREEGAKIRERIEKSRTDMIAALTAEQKEAFVKMQGKKFEFPQQQGFGGGRRPGGDGGQPRGRPETKKDDK